MEHPITPPPKLVEQWYDAIDNSSTSWKQELTTKAARWGADQELEACCEWLPSDLTINGESLRAARRPKPPSLAEQAMDRCNDYIDPDGIIRRALERLQELEKGDE